MEKQQRKRRKTKSDPKDSKQGKAEPNVKGLFQRVKQLFNYKAVKPN